jgi:LysR family transcriptional regulator, glycine cleavage system transcriptional activator
MHASTMSLNGLRAFEAAARHQSLSKAAQELHVTSGALSHQIRGLERLLGLRLFDRQVRKIVLTLDGERLYPALKSGFAQIRDAIEMLRECRSDRIVAISTPPGFTAHWLAPRLYRFVSAYPEIDARVSSSTDIANLAAEGIDIAVRNMPGDATVEQHLAVEKLHEHAFLPVCSPKLLKGDPPLRTADALKALPLIHDEMLSNRTQIPNWADWFKAADVKGANLRRGLRFNSLDHALDAAIEGAGVVLVQDILAYDDLKTGRLVVPFDLRLRTGRAYFLIRPKERQPSNSVESFCAWIRNEVASMDWKRVAAASKRRSASSR